jgi:hypothetical protein
MIHQKYTQPVGGLTLQKKLQATISTVFYDGRVVPEHTKYEHFYRDTKDGSLYPSVTGALQVLNKPHLKQWAVNRAIEHIINWASKIPIITKVGLYEQLEIAKKAHTVKLEQASIWGTDGHDVVDMYVDRWITQGKKPVESILTLASADISNEGKCAALGAEKFFNDYTLFPIVSEKKIISKKHRIGGTLDSLWLIGEVYKDRKGDEFGVHEWLEKGDDHIRCRLCGREEKLSVIMIDLKTSNNIIDDAYAMQVSTYGYGILSEMCKIKPKLHWILQLDKNKPKYTIGVIDEPKKAFDAFLLAHALNQYRRSNPDAVRMLITKQVIKL